MKKFTLFMGLIVTSTTLTFAFAGEMGRMMRSVGPEAIMATGLGGLILLVGILFSYLAISYGTYLLAKKYAPKLHPAWSWIPVAQIYPIVVVSGQSPWWIAAILLGQFVPVIGGLIVLGSIIYIYYWLSKRVGRDIGTTVLLLFFSVIMIPYLGLKAHGKSTTPAFLLGVGAILALLIGGGIGAAGAARGMMGLEGQYNFMGKTQEKIMEEIKDNPELQRQFQEIKNQMQANTEIKDAMMKINQQADVSATAQ